MGGNDPEKMDEIFVAVVIFIFRSFTILVNGMLPNLLIMAFDPCMKKHD